MEIVDGIKKLSEIEKFRFRYYKNFRSHNISIESLNEFVPTDPDNYGIKVNESNLDNYKNFFSKSYVDDIVMTESILTIKKSYADPLHFKFIDFGPTVKTLNSIKESFNTQDFSEIIFLSKYVGDYNITKYGNKLTFENSGSTLVLERIT
jgi:vesicle coat complex subunit